MDDNKATFEKLIIGGSQKYLQGLSPQWPIIPVNGNGKLLGAAIETRMRMV